jgi:hypothetical protein
MSSPSYSADLVTEPLLRRIVLGSGVALLCGGQVVIASLPLPGSWRALAMFAWTVSVVRELLHLAASYREYRAVRISSDGSVEILGKDQATARARLLPGSLVLPGLAWLRLGLEGNRTSGELLRGNAGENEAWRRLQVIWRHLGGLQ